MAKCYLMIEDVDDGTDAGQVQFAATFGGPTVDGVEQLPTREEMTPAQEATWNFYNVLRGMFDRQHKRAMEKEVAQQIVMPAHVADESAN